MPNPILSQMNLRGLNVQQVKQAWNNLRSLNNPQAMLNQMAQQNPVVGQLLKYRTPQEAFYALAKEKGVNPDDILNMLR